MKVRRGPASSNDRDAVYVKRFCKEDKVCGGGLFANAQYARPRRYSLALDTRRKRHIYNDALRGWGLFAGTRARASRCVVHVIDASKVSEPA